MASTFSLLRIMTIGLGLGLCSSPSSEGGELSADLQDALQRAGARGELQVVIQLRERLTLQAEAGESKAAFRQRYNLALQAKADSAQAELRGWLSSRGVTEWRTLWAINALAATVPTVLLHELASRPEIEIIRLDRTIAAPSLAPQPP